jgi:hypothetical protein
MRRFQLKRNKDVRGVSDTGAVAEGVEFSNGMCAVMSKGHQKVALRISTLDSSNVLL